MFENELAAAAEEVQMGIISKETNVRPIDLYALVVFLISELNEQLWSLRVFYVSVWWS